MDAQNLLEVLLKAKVKIQALIRSVVRLSAHPFIRFLIRIALSFSRLPPTEVSKIDNFLQSYPQREEGQHPPAHKDSIETQDTDTPSPNLSLDEAARQGDAKAQFNLGVRYAKGEGVAQDKKEAVYWYRQSAEQGFAIAQLALGTSYLMGEGVPKNEETAYMWLLLARVNGDAEIQRVVVESIDLLESILSRAEIKAAQAEAQMQEKKNTIQARTMKEG